MSKLTEILKRSIELTKEDRQLMERLIYKINTNIPDRPMILYIRENKVHENKSQIYLSIEGETHVEVTPLLIKKLKEAVQWLEEMTK